MQKEGGENSEFKTAEKPTYRDVVEHMREINKRISPLLRQVVADIEDPQALEIINYFFEPRYEKPKVRPLLAQLSFEAVSRQFAERNPEIKDASILGFAIIEKLCVAIRLIDGASLIHDDALDHTLIRDNQESVYAKFGYEKALITGEILRERANQIFFQAIEAQEAAYDEFLRKSDYSAGDVKVDDLGRNTRTPIPGTNIEVKRGIDIQRKVIDIFNDIWHKGYIGQLIDQENFTKDKTPTVEENERRLYLLAGQFIEKVMLLGAYATGLDEEQEKMVFKGLGNYGKYYGMATQLRNDLLDFAPIEGYGKDTAIAKRFNYDDFKEGKQTLPLILARDQCDPDEQRLIFDQLGDEIDDDNKLKINQILEQRQVIRDIQRQIFEYSKKAIESLKETGLESREIELLKAWALALNNTINISFTGERGERKVDLNSLESIEAYLA